MTREVHPLTEDLNRHSRIYRPVFEWRFLMPTYWPTWLGVFLLWVLAWVPWQVRSILAWPLTKLTWWLSGKRRRITRINLKLCFPQMPDAELDQLINRHFFLKVRTFLDYGILWFRSHKRIQRLVQIEGLEHYARIQEKGEAVIFLSCHSLALDYGAAILTSRYPGVSLAKPTRNRLLNWFLQRGRIRFNACLYTRAEGLRPIVKGINKGAFFIYYSDEGLGGPDSCFVPFFGVRKSTLATMGRLAKLTRAVIVPSYTWYRNGKYVNRLSAPLKDFPRATREEDAAGMNEALMEMILLEPAHYMWGLKLFNLQPEGYANPYD